MLTVARWQLLPPALKTPFLGFCKKRLMWQIYTFFLKNKFLKTNFHKTYSSFSVKPVKGQNLGQAEFSEKFF